MKKLILISSILAIFVGCGSSSKDSNSPTNNNSDSSVSDLISKSSTVKSAHFTQTFRNRASTTSTGKMQRKFNKLEAGIYPCSYSGTYTITISEEADIIEYMQCIEQDSSTNKYLFQNGRVGYAEKNNIFVYGFEDYLYIPDYENHSETGEHYQSLVMAFSSSSTEEKFFINGGMDIYKEGKVVEKLSYTDFLYRENLQTKAIYVEGKTSNKALCLNENHQYKTSVNAWLVPYDNNQDYFKSGTIVIDDMKYVYNNDKVTLYKDGKSGTFTQKEILEKAEALVNNDSCANPNQLSKVNSNFNF